MDGLRSDGATAADIRARLDHPVIDADGHILEFVPALLDFLNDAGGPAVVERYREAMWGPSSKAYRDVWWTMPSAEHSIDTMTAMLPGLYYERLAEFGHDFAILYPSLGLAAPFFRDAELRRAACRAHNDMSAEFYAPYSDRMTPAAVIPCYTPAEAIAELDHAVLDLGLKVVMLGTEIRDSVPQVAEAAPDLARHTERVWSLAMDPPHDFDPFWQRCVELKVSPTGHTKTMGGGTTRRSETNFVFNHLGAFASGAEFFARSLFMGGVTRRFPDLAFGLLEGGVAWGSTLYNDLIEHWEKRNAKALLANLDPRKFDQSLAEEMFSKYGNAHLSAERIRAGTPFRANDLEMTEAELDEFAACGIETAQDIRDLFVPRFYFGCEADDAMVPVGFDRSVNRGDKLNAFYSSDIGHWDVVDATAVLPEAYEFLEDGRLSEADFRAFTFENVVRLHAGANPDFFKGTAVEAEATAMQEKFKPALRN